jgi:terminase small subunit-like protein
LDSSPQSTKRVAARNGQSIEATVFPSTKKTGRPRKLTQPVQDALCSAIRNGATLYQAGQQVSVDEDTITRERARSPSFAENLKKAIEERAELWADQLVSETEALPEDCTHEQINRQRLRNGVRMWRCRVDHPQRFGDKPQAQVQVGMALRLTEDQRMQLLERRERALRE